VGQKDIGIYINAASHAVAFLNGTTFRPAIDAGELIFPYIFNILKHTIFKSTLLDLDEIFQIWNIFYCNSQQKKMTSLITAICKLTFSLDHYIYQTLVHNGPTLRPN